MTNWLLLLYSVPNEPSARRVYVWRKLKGLGALLVHDSAWVLPATPHTREKLQWLATEIKDMEGGAAMLWEAQQVFTGQEDTLVRQFTEQVEGIYRTILANLDKDDADLVALSRQYQQAKSQDYFHSALGEQVREALVQQRGVDDS